jgi:hypothetical protein
VVLVICIGLLELVFHAEFGVTDVCGLGLPAGFVLPLDDHMVWGEFGKVFWESVCDAARHGAAAATLFGLVSLGVRVVFPGRFEGEESAREVCYDGAAAFMPGSAVLGCSRAATDSR